MTAYDPEDRERKRHEDSNSSAWVLFWCLFGCGVLLALSWALS